MMMMKIYNCFDLFWIQFVSYAILNILKLTQKKYEETCLYTLLISDFKIKLE